MLQRQSRPRGLGSVHAGFQSVIVCGLDGGEWRDSCRQGIGGTSDATAVWSVLSRIGFVR